MEPDDPRRRQREAHRRGSSGGASSGSAAETCRARSSLENRQIHIPDLDNVDPAIADWPGLPPARAAGTRTMCRHAASARGQGDRRSHRPSRPARAVHRRGTGAAAKFCRPGRDRHRERAAVQRDRGGAGAADRDRRHPEGDRQSRRRTCSRCSTRSSSSAVRLCGGRMRTRISLSTAASFTWWPVTASARRVSSKVQQVFPRPATDDTIAGQVMLSHRPYFVTDIRHAAIRACAVAADDRGAGHAQPA